MILVLPSEAMADEATLEVSGDFNNFERDMARIHREQLRERWRPAGTVSPNSSEASSTAMPARNIDGGPLEGSNLPIREVRNNGNGRISRHRDRSRRKRKDKEVKGRKWRRVEKYLKAETLLKTRMEAKKKEQMRDSYLHPEYAACWTEFYKDKFHQNGGKIISKEEITDEWKEIWRIVFEELYVEEATGEVHRLLRRHRLDAEDVLKFNEQAYPLPVQANEPPAAEEEQVWSLSVIGNLRFLTAFDETILGETMVLRILASLHEASDVDERDGVEASNEMIDDADFYLLVGAARDRLLAEMAIGTRLDGAQRDTAAACVANLNALMARSKWAATWFRPPPASPPPNIKWDVIEMAVAGAEQLAAPSIAALIDCCDCGIEATIC